ncbi:hypothetical protein Pst134EA_022511 [Puccinia striiformis f. sp. tritici]|uniref:hypothetical protein n=1 Tax=Puccinia striiformis f. sp. tritici TaxID=168172 RepID=UPI0020089E7F|nr:hypothetical protein Pst134EA_022511 [Puccinia striiformis f. sp. tritici]KAH9455033.1 hypothetical protein Pst134EA_022511 [Puccinia striiformis f. sp. tritici]
MNGTNFIGWSDKNSSTLSDSMKTFSFSTSFLHHVSPPVVCLGPCHKPLLSQYHQLMKKVVYTFSHCLSPLFHRNCPGRGREELSSASLISFHAIDDVASGHKHISQSSLASEQFSNLHTSSIFYQLDVKPRSS